MTSPAHPPTRLFLFPNRDRERALTTRRVATRPPAARRAAGFSLRGDARRTCCARAVPTTRGRCRVARRPCSARPAQAKGGAASAFTLIEMVVVIAVILIIVGIVVPASTALWSERRMAQAINTIQGLLMTTRAEAFESDGVEVGLFAFVNDRGEQHFVKIQQPSDRLADPAWQNVFEITDDKDHVLPAPIRAVPRYLADDPAAAANSYDVFSEEELANNNFADPSLVAPTFDQAQRHRNFFSFIYTTGGRLLEARDVLILDEDENGDTKGDRTGLDVGAGPTPANPTTPPTVTDFYPQEGGAVAIDPTGAGQAIPFLVLDPASTTRAINFPSVDGLLVYDDASFSAIPDKTAKRDVLLRTAQPLYVNRYTGMVIRGPVGESN